MYNLLKAMQLLKSSEKYEKTNHVSGTSILCFYFRTNDKGVLYLSYAPGSSIIKTW